MNIGVHRDTFVILAKIASCEVLMLTHDGYYVQKDGLTMGSPPATHDGYYVQKDGLAMGSPPAPHVANGSMYSR